MFSYGDYSLRYFDLNFARKQPFLVIYTVIGQIARNLAIFGCLTNKSQKSAHQQVTQN